MKLYNLSTILWRWLKLALFICAGIALLITILLILTGCSYAPAPTVTPPRARVPYVLPVTEASVVTDGCWQQTSKVVVVGISVWWEPDTARYKACVMRLL